MSNMFTRDDLRTGMFGITSNGLKFVVVDDYLVYEHGEYDYKNMSFHSYKVEKVFDNCRSFNQLHRILSGVYKSYDLVYDCNASVEMTISEIEQKLGIKNLKIIGEDK